MMRDVLRRTYFLLQRWRYRLVLLGKNVRWGPGVRLYGGIVFKVGGRGVLDLGGNIRISGGTYILADGRMRIGANTLVGSNCILASLHEIEIGDDCLIGHMVSIRDHEHEILAAERRISEQGFREGAVRIGDNVWLGDKVTVTSGVTIGENSVVGANAVVTRDIPPNVVAAGVPARVIRARR